MKNHERLARQTCPSGDLGGFQVVTGFVPVPQLLAQHAQDCLHRFETSYSAADLEEAQECLANIAVAMGSNPRSLMERAHIRAEREGPLTTSGLNGIPRVWAVPK